MINPDSKIFLVDASIYIFRAYFSLPPRFHDVNGELNHALYGYTGFLLDLMTHKPTHVSLAYDESLNTCYRNAIYPPYKANRDLPDDNLEHQLTRCLQIGKLLGLHSLSLTDFEADDIIGSIQRQVIGESPCIIVTRDKDLGQLLRDGDRLWDFANDEYLDRAGVRDKFGVHSHQIADYLALAGDSVDNIPGATGIGARTASILLNHFTDIDDLYARIDDVLTVKVRGAARIHAVLVEQEAEVRRFKEITTINERIPLTCAVGDLQPEAPDPGAIDAFCEVENFGSGLWRRIRDYVASHGR